MKKLLKIFRAEVKSVDAEHFTLEALVSTKKVDRDGDIVMPEAFDKRLKIYKDHPVLLSSHDYRDLRKQIGEAVNIKSTDEGLLAKFKYYVGDGNPEADWAWVLAQKGVAAYSIGFMAHDFEWIEEKDEEGNKRITGRKFTDVELLEVSQVLVPSNRGALQMGVEPSAEEIQQCELAMKSIQEKGGEVVEIKEECPLCKFNPTLKPEETGDFIRIPVRDCDITATITISADEGIKALYCGKVKKVGTYLFAKDKGWTMEKAKKWVHEHDDGKSFELTEDKEGHYIDFLLGTEAQAKSEPKGDEINVDVIKEIAKGAISETLTK